MFISHIRTNNSNDNKTMKQTKTYCKNTFMKFCYLDQRRYFDEFWLWLNLVLIFDSPCLVGSKGVIELYKITRIGMILLNPEITRTIGFDMKLKYR